jgi:tRNA pseudouridine55 synthase
MTISPSINGFVLINKTVNHSSNHIVQKVKRLLGAQKAGHTGTLDPFADGLMIMTLGHTTKVSQFLLDAHKSYRAVLQFGAQTDSGDLTGRIIESNAHQPTPAQLLETISSFLGPQLQVPPMFSALKSNGKALYEYAKQGISIERKARPIDILSITLLESNLALKQATLDIECSKGTYIRTLAEDIAKACGCLAHLIKLTRTSQFILANTTRTTLSLSDAIDLDQLNQMTPVDRALHLKPTQQLLSHLPRISLSAAQYERWLCGQRLKLNTDTQDLSTTEIATTEIISCIYFNDQLIGIGKKIGDVLHPERLLVDPVEAIESMKTLHQLL